MFAVNCESQHIIRRINGLRLQSTSRFQLECTCNFSTVPKRKCPGNTFEPESADGRSVKYVHSDGWLSNTSNGTLANVTVEKYAFASNHRVYHRHDFRRGRTPESNPNPSCDTALNHWAVSSTAIDGLQLIRLTSNLSTHCQTGSGLTIHDHLMTHSYFLVHRYP